MGNRVAFFAIAAAVVGGSLAIGPRASAAPNMAEFMRDPARYTAGDGGGEFGVRATNFTGITPPPMGPGVAGPQSLFQTFCLELDESISTHDNYNSDIEYNGPHYIYSWTLDTAVQLGGRNTNSGDPISPQTAYLYTQFYFGTLAGYDYTFGPGRVASATALQDAFWYLENEFGDASNGFSPPPASVLSPASLAFVNAANSAVAGSWGNTIGDVRVMNTVADDGVTLAQSVLVMTDPNTTIGGDPCPPSAIVSNFNGTSIPAGQSVWFNSVMKVKNAATCVGDVVIDVTQQTVVSPKFNVVLPKAHITFSAAATTAKTTYDAGTKTWNTIVPKTYTGNVFISGAMLPLPNGLTGGTSPVTWTATFSHPECVDIQWQWAAAAYNQLFSPDFSTLGVKSVDSNSLDATYKNSDHAGTPEVVKSLVKGGARGGGGSNYTGSYSGTGKVCVD